VKQAPGLMMKFRGWHVICISSWLKLDILEFELCLRHYNKETGLTEPYGLSAINNIRSKTASRFSAKHYENTVVAN
jgi:hypothetical protein